MCANNGGGGIFDFLPLADHGAGPTFEEHVITPSGVDLYEVQYDSKGNVKRVQNYSDKIHKRATRACPVNRAKKAHDKLKERLAKNFEKHRAKIMGEVADRLE